MEAIMGTIKNGQIVPDTPTSWPDGCRVSIKPVSEASPVGLSDEDWPDTPEEIEDWIRWYDSLEPIIRTPEEEAEWKAARQAQKEFEHGLAHAADRYPNRRHRPEPGQPHREQP